MTESRPARRPRRRRWLWVLLTLALLVAAGPTLLSLTPIPSQLLADALPSEAGRLSTRGIWLSWTGATSVSGLELTDSEGSILFSAEQVDIGGGVLALMAGDSAALDVRVVKPRIDLVLTPEGTNLDRLIAAIEKKQEEAEAADPSTAQSRRPLRVVVVDGSARITETKSGAQWLAEEVNVGLTDPGRGIDSIALAAEGNLSAQAGDVANNSNRGRFKFDLGPADEGGRLASVLLEAAPLALVEPWLRQTDPSLRVAGVADVRGEAAWRSTSGAIPSTAPADIFQTLVEGGVRSAGTIRLRDVGLRGQLTKGGPIRLGNVEIPWQVAATPDGIGLEQLDWQSDIGNAAIDGLITAAEVEAWSRGVGVAPRQVRMEGNLDLRRLASAAPQWVQLQQGTRIDSGQVNFKVNSTDGRVVATLDSGALAGIARGEPIQWTEPLDVRIAAVQREPQAGWPGWWLEALKAESSFFHANATGDASRLTGDADFDLNRLASELAPFVDLGETQLTGTGRTQFTLTRNRAMQIWRLNGSGRVEGLMVGDPQTPLASEPNLRFTTALEGSLAEPTTLPTGQVELTAGDDVLAITLPNAEAATAQPFELSFSGDVVRWYRRAGFLVVDLPTAQSIALSGAIEASAAGVVGADGGRLDRSRIVLTGLNLDTASLDPSTPRLRLLDERLEASAKGTWNRVDQAVQVADGKLLSSVVSAGLREVFVSLSDPAASRGEIAYRVDLGRLNAWTPPRGEPARYVAAGGLEGSLKIRGGASGLTLVGDAVGQQLALLDRFPTGNSQSDPVARPVEVWSEPTLNLKADAMLLPIAARADQGATYQLDLRQATIKSPSIDGSVAGQIADALAMRGVKLAGGVNYDLEKLTPILWPSLGDGIRLVGRDRATFRLETLDQAPPDAAAILRFRGSIVAPWQSADVYGLAVGPGQLSAKLNQGMVRIDPLDVAIGGGRLTTEAAVTLEPPPTTLSLKPGPLLTDVAMSKDVNQRMLKYIAPVLADATRIEGRFSLTLRELSLPLDPALTPGPPPGRAAGTLNIQRVRVTPGPTTAEWIGLIKRLESLVRDGVQSVVQPSDSVLVAIDNSNVEFRMVEGRIYHRGLAFYVGEALVQSEGSVGVDESLDLVLSVPILDKWVDRRPKYLERLRGQSLKIPIQGTFSKPRVNQDAFVQLSRQLLENAAAGAIEGGLRKLFEKL